MTNDLMMFDGITHISLGGELVEIVSIESLPSQPGDAVGTHRYRINAKRQVQDGGEYVTLEFIGRRDEAK